MKHRKAILLVCTTSFRYIIEPQKLYISELNCVKKQQATSCCSSQRCIWGVEDTPGCLKSLCHPLWATESWGMASLATGLLPQHPSPLMWAASAAQSTIVSWFDSFLAVLHCSQNQLNGENCFHSTKQLQKNLLFWLNLEVSFCTLSTLLSGTQ